MKLRTAGACLIVVVFVGAFYAQSRTPAPQAPIFEVDPYWPKPLAESLGSRIHHRPVGRCAGSRLGHSPAGDR